MQFIILADYCLPTLSIMPLLSSVSLNQNPPGIFFFFHNLWIVVFFPCETPPLENNNKKFSSYLKIAA